MADNEKKPPQIRRAIMGDIIRNTDTLAKQLQAGYACDKEMLVKTVNRMLAFLNEVIKPKADEARAKEEVKADVREVQTAEQGE